MAKLNPEIEALVNEARQCEIRGEYAEALDIYEEIERRGTIHPELIIAKGTCLLQTRQRQDARKAWIRAFEIAPDNQEVIDLLDKNFKGWEKTMNKRSGAGESAPPPPPSPGGDSTKLNLTVEMTTSAPERVERREAPIRPEETHGAGRGVGRTAPQPREPDPEFENTGSLRPSAKPSAQPSAPAARPVPQNASRVPAGNQLPPINWDYVMADAMAESGKSH